MYLRHVFCTRFATGLFALVAFILTVCVASPAAADASSAGLARIVASDYTVTRVQSVIFTALIGTTPLLTTASGDSSSGVPATAAMHIRAGIVQTEALDAILVKLADEKRVSLDAPLAKWFPSLPRARRVTLRMLGNNRAGYGDYLNDLEFYKALNENPFQTFKPDDLISIGMRQPMKFSPGNGFAYAHTNAVLLGAALQRITGESVADLIADYIAAPLHLSQTRVPHSADIDEPVQHVFYRDRGPYEDSTYWDPSWAVFSGTITSTIQDVAVMQRAFGSGALVSKAGFAAILAPTNADTPPQNKALYFGLGVIVGNTWILQHAQVAGSDVVMGYLPERDLTIVVSTAISFKSKPTPRGFSQVFFNDAAKYLAPERPIPILFFK